MQLFTNRVLRVTIALHHIRHSHSHSDFFLGQFCPRGEGSMRLTLCEAPTHEVRPDHNNDMCVGSLTSPANYVTLKMQETEPMV